MPLQHAISNYNNNDDTCAVIRFTREQLISLRKESRVLSSLLPMVDIVSTDSLSPVCFSRLEPEDVIHYYFEVSSEMNL